MTTAAPEIWFLTGSQEMYGPDTLRQVAEQSREVADRLADSDDIAARVIWQPVLTSAADILAVCREANARRVGDRCGRLDAHVLAGEDVDRRPGRAAQTVAAPAHAGQPGAALGRAGHGLHEPEPGRARRPGVRLHPGPARRAAQDRRRPRQRPPGAAGASATLGPGGPRLRRDADAAAGPVRRQHARRRGDRGRQGRGPAALRRLRQHLRRQRPGRRRRRGAATSEVDELVSRVRGAVPAGPGAAARAATGTTRCGTRPGSRPRCATSSTRAASARSPRTSRTSAACASCPGSRCSG